MASESETVMAVCAEWRDCLESADPSVWNDERIAGLVKTTKAQQLAYLARIEAAWKRDKAEAEAEALAVGGVVEAARHKPGNAAAMREALREAIGETCAGCKRDCDDCINLKSGWMKKAKDALTAPARNCDLKECSTDDGMISAHERFCESWHDDGKTCAECPNNPKSPIMTCREKWLLAPAAEEGARE